MNIFVKQIFSGKTLGRILFNKAVEKNSISLRGKVLDLAGGLSPSYARFLPLEGVNFEKTDIVGTTQVDMNKPLPYPDETFDGVVFFNALYIAKKPQVTLQEIYRVLKKEGEVHISMPFVSSEIPEPNDYGRFTHEGLERILNEAGFKEVSIERIGGKWVSAANLLHDFWFLSVVRLLVYSLALFLDEVTKQYQEKYPAPLSYYCIAKK